MTGGRVALAMLTSLVLCQTGAQPVPAQYTLVPMDKEQADHLRAYGLAWWALAQPREFVVEWLLNYRGGSWIIHDDSLTPRHALLQGVTTEALTDAEYGRVQRDIATGPRDAGLNVDIDDVSKHVGLVQRYVATRLHGKIFDRRDRG